MTAWRDFAASVPDLVVLAATRLVGRVAYFATIRPDGGPRLHPVTAHISNGQFFVYMNRRSPKVRDLMRDHRYALHCCVENTSGGGGELSIRGTAMMVNDSVQRAALFEAARANGFNPRDDYSLFELNVVSVLWTIYDGEVPIRRRWKGADSK